MVKFSCAVAACAVVAAAAGFYPSEGRRTLAPHEIWAVNGGQVSPYCCGSIADCVATNDPCGNFPVGTLEDNLACRAHREKEPQGVNDQGCFFNPNGDNCTSDPILDDCLYHWRCRVSADPGTGMEFCVRDPDLLPDVTEGPDDCDGPQCT